jgi:hypothetical protein
MDDFKPIARSLIKQRCPSLMATKIKNVTWQEVCDKLRIIMAEIEMNGVPIKFEKRKID